MNKPLDIYFNSDYGKICTFIEPGECILYECATNNGIIRNMFIKRPVPWLVDGVQYYDIVTPYGYGGPIICETNNIDGLVADYKTQFRHYCEEHNIVCEFIRYHPIFRNWEPFEDVYDNSFSRHTVGTNLFDYDDPVQSEFSKGARKELRRAINRGVTCSVHPQPDDLSVFKRLYEETMDRNNASEMYYFPNEYYSLLTTNLRPFILEIQAHYEGEIIASEIYFIEGNLMHAHLLGSNDKLLSSGGGVMLEATAAKWGKENGYKYIHHGGGRTSKDDDSLYLYKKKFGNNTLFDFYTGKKIWNETIYEKLVGIRKSTNIELNNDYFPIYRG